MGHETGAIKWAIGMLLTPIGFASLYIFGNGMWNTVTNIRGLLHVVQHLDSPADIVNGLISIYVPTPETVLSSLIIYPVVGATVGAALWYKGSKF